MRSSKSRSRSKSNRNRPANGANVVNRVFDSSGPEGKVRGTPQQIIDKYNQLARDAQLSNDRVAAENFQQHAEHYLRLLNEAQREIEARREEQERQNRERQAERDRERAERLERQEREAAAKAQDPADAPQPDVIDPRESTGQDAAQDHDSGLVETPESKDETAEPAPKKPARKPRAPRKTAPKKASDDAQGDEAASGEAKEEGSKKPAAKKPSRSRAKAKPEDTAEAAE
ncbi:DUF4167 domain-containing protein [Phycobacter azelaicus]|uniref:DUF4167 domain-containing protein n=1 Tax=Phycobacter azelaicus TaxID=2668075 RepID=UPI0018691AE0|nr:DUF4167 domain-containing protein [Phycobacter azelaicus]MBE1298206.1 DUF4167 domain-containing protein [Paracoccaceae bacterium]